MPRSTNARSWMRNSRFSAISTSWVRCQTTCSRFLEGSMAKYTIGLDLGQAQDYSALVIVEQSDDRTRYDVREIRRWPLGTSYPAIVADVAALVGLPQLVGPALVVDATGVGRPVVELFAIAGCEPKGVMITAGSHATRDTESGYWHVPKKELVSSVQIHLQSCTLQIEQALPEARTLTEELLNFQVKITAAANDVYGEWRTGKHDDLVLALALALWYAPRHIAAWDLVSF